MKIAIIISHPEMGGAQRVSLNLVEWLQNSASYEASIIALSHLEKGAYDMTRYDYHYLKSKIKVLELRKLLKSLSPDVVLTMGVPLCLYTIPATIGLHLKHIVSERNDPSHFAGKKSTALVSRLLMKHADGYVFQTNDAQAFYGGGIAKKSTVIPNPLFNISKMPAAIYEEVREKSIVTVGRLNLQKNHILLIDAFAAIAEEYPDYKLIIWGDGGERGKLENYVKECKLEKKVILPGTSNKIFDHIYKSSLFILSSDFEGMPNALMEAMALGLPVISTNCPCGGPSFLIKDGNNGILVPVGDKGKLLKAMKFMLDNPDRAKEMGQKAFYIREQLSELSINQKWLHYFKTISAKQ